MDVYSWSTVFNFESSKGHLTGKILDLFVGCENIDVQRENINEAV